MADVKKEELAAKPDGKNDRKNSKWLLLLLILLLLLACGTIVWLVFFNGKPSASVPEPSKDYIAGRGLILTPDNLDELAAMQRSDDEKRYTATMTKEWKFGTNGVSKGGIYVENAVENAHTVYFDLIVPNPITGANDVVYSSPFIQVGGRLTSISLNRKLVNGTHTAYVRYQMVGDDYADIPGAGVTVTVNLDVF